MPEQFLHGVEVLQIDAGPRPIATVKSSVIGICGTAPDSQPEVTATLTTGTVANNNALLFTSVLKGVLGNNISIALTDPKANSAALAVTVTGTYIAVSLATDATGAVTSTAAEIIAAITASTAASALVTAADSGASTGAGTVVPVRRVYLSGGVDEAFPLNTPTLIAGSRITAAALGKTGTLPDAIDTILDQVGAAIIVVRVEAGADAPTTQANVIGGVNASNGQLLGVHAFTAAESIAGFAPRLLIAPGFTGDRTSSQANAVVAEMVGIAERLRAVIIADGPNTTDADAYAYAEDWGTKRLFVVDPGILKVDATTGATIHSYTSALAAGLTAKSDNERGFWWSPSNQTANGIVGTVRAVDFALGDVNSSANLLNEKNVATVIHQNGYRLWGNRTCSSDPVWAFLSVVRTADIIDDSLLRAHLWAVDRNITKGYIEAVLEGVNDYLRHLKAIGAIIDGSAWADPALNTPDQIQQGKVYFDFDFTPPYPAEHIQFRSHLTNKYLTEIF